MEIPRHWRLKAQRYRLEGSICPTCGQLSFLPRPVCPHCTTQPLRIDACGPSVFPTSICTTGLEAHIPYEFIERMIG